MFWLGVSLHLDRRLVDDNELRWSQTAATAATHLSVATHKSAAQVKEKPSAVAADSKVLGSNFLRIELFNVSYSRRSDQ